MSLPRLTVVPAGAGSGKTHHIQETLGRWVADSAVAPDRIVAVTFTESAAAELRNRIRGQLLDSGRVEDALRLDQSYISTIHSFGLRLLTEFAFEAGLTPAPRPLRDEDARTLVALALARTDAALPVMDNLRGFGYRYDGYSGLTAEDQFRETVRGVTAHLQTLGTAAGRPNLAEDTTQWMAQRYGETGDGRRLIAALEARVRALLDAFPENLAPDYGNSAAADRELRRDHQNLHRALKRGALHTEWSLWQELRKLRTSKRRATLPPEYDRLAEAVKEAADALPRHPGPLEQALRHVYCLITTGQDVLRLYADVKREAGLVDYGDMVALAHRLLGEQHHALHALVQRVDCLVIDEFQDTNPAQFALLWQLTASGVPTLVVGDLKQAIMGFQGADARLLEAIERRFPSAARPLTSNWRSQPSLLAFLNALGIGLFGEHYVPLEPEREPSDIESLDVIEFAKRVNKDWHEVRASHVACHLRTLLERDSSLRGSDCAVLCPTNNMVDRYAGQLRRMGFQVRVQQSGWLGSRIVQIACHALAYLANPADRHAALYLAVTEVGTLELEAALRQLMDGGPIDDPPIRALDALREEIPDAALDEMVSRAIAVLDLYGEVSTWPDADQGRANLLRLEGEAGAYLSASREALAAAGYFGSGLPSFLAWLPSRSEAEDGQPEPRVVDENAVEVTTWHRAKGREWRVSVVCGLDREVKPSLPHTALGYPDFDDLARLLQTARIEYSPGFDAPEVKRRFLDALRPSELADARRRLYVAVTRARDKLVLEWPSYLASKDKDTYWSILTREAGVRLDEASLRVGPERFPCTIRLAAPTAGSEVDVDDAAGPSPLPVIGRRALRHVARAFDATPDSVTPSQLEPTDIDLPPGLPRAECYADDGLQLDLDIEGATLGTALHRCFEILAVRPDAAGHLGDLVEVDMDAATARRIADAVHRFETWLRARFAPSAVAREVPFVSLRPTGSVLSGVVDVVVETSTGPWIIDHKSESVQDPVSEFRRHAPQLAAYAEAFTGRRVEGAVQGVGINWIRTGVVTLLSLAPPSTA